MYIIYSKTSLKTSLGDYWGDTYGHHECSPAINTFKARLDKFWENQDVRYNLKADISFTGSRSKVELTID